MAVYPTNRRTKDVEIAALGAMTAGLDLFRSGLRLVHIIRCAAMLALAKNIAAYELDAGCEPRRTSDFYALGRRVLTRPRGANIVHSASPVTG